MNTESKTMGRPRKALKLPRSRHFTVSDIHKLNRKTIKCRLTIYTRVGELVKEKVLRLTGDTITSAGKNGVGKPLELLERL
jgi:hypothetical protein